MQIAVLTERAAGETRVAASPDSVRKLIALGAQVSVERGAGLSSAISDEAFAEAGAILSDDTDALLASQNLMLLCVRKPEAAIRERLPSGTVLIGLLEPLAAGDDIAAYAEQGLTAFAMELLPRISRAQSMDVLSSQSNLAGYRAVIEAVYHFNKAMPMMMTAAGTVPPAKVCVIGAGVAGLQAIATAKRLGAVVSAFDVRPAVKEQVESLGASFVEVPADEAEAGEASGGYAKEMSEAYKKRQQEILSAHLTGMDIVITTALIPGKPAPVLISEDTVRAMKDGSVIVDLAASAGGNCPLTEPDRMAEHHGVILIGHTNLPGRVAVDASRLYARNLQHFLELLIDHEHGGIRLNLEDEILRDTLVAHEGKIMNERIYSASSPESP